MRLSLVPSLFVTLLVSAVPCAPATAQDSRAGEAAARQAEKSKQLRPNEAGGAERALEWFEEHFTDPNTVYMTFGGIYPSAGFAPGIAWRRAMGHARFNIGGAWSLKNYKLAHTSLRFPELANNKIELEGHALWVDATQVPFYGIGGETVRDDRVNYGLQSSEFGGSVTLKPVCWFRVRRHRCLADRGSRRRWHHALDRAASFGRDGAGTVCKNHLHPRERHGRYRLA